MKDLYQTARLKYKPDNIRFLFIAEAPPEDESRFFYYEDVGEHDALFINTIKVLYPDFEVTYGKSDEAIRNNKLHLLNRLKQDGYYLIDALPESINLELSSGKRNKLIKQNRENLVEEIKGLSSKSEGMLVILIKATVYDSLYEYLLQNKIPVINNGKIYFPLYQYPSKFRSQLTKLLKKYDKVYLDRLKMIKFFNDSMLPELNQRIPRAYWLLENNMEYQDLMNLKDRITKITKFDDLSQSDQKLIVNAEKTLAVRKKKLNERGLGVGPLTDEKSVIS